MTDERSASRGSLRSIEGLRDANPLEIFNALAEPHLPVPQVLIELYGASATLGPQGWARDLVAEFPQRHEYCPEAGGWNFLGNFCHEPL